MATVRIIDKTVTHTGATEIRRGRIDVELKDGRSVTADYIANAHRLEIWVRECRIVCGATSWCNAIKWGYEFDSGLEVERVAAEVELYMMRRGMA